MAHAKATDWVCFTKEHFNTDLHWQMFLSIGLWKCKFLCTIQLHLHHIFIQTITYASKHMNANNTAIQLFQCTHMYACMYVYMYGLDCKISRICHFIKG